MSDYQLLYWSVPFRGQFVRAVLAFAGKSWDETDDAEISRLMGGPVAEMPVPFMGPPVLIDQAAGFAIAQMPAILLYLGDTLDLLSATPARRAMTIKLVNDANDVIDEMTLEGGRDMWSEARWQEAVPRVRKWLTLWEETGRRHGLASEHGHILGESQPGMADIVTATLWTTLADRFSRIESLLEDTAPLTAALCRRVSALPPLAALAQTARQDYGDAYCGGQIGASMAAVLDP
jgi:glutathione S-transferase